MFCTMSRLSESARSWYTVAIPALVASLGVRKCTGLPCQKISPPLGSQMPEIVLISVDLPAPLSPTRAVTWPAGMSRSMSVSACTGPKFLPMPRSRSSGSASFTFTSCLITSSGVRAGCPHPGRAVCFGTSWRCRRPCRRSRTSPCTAGWPARTCPRRRSSSCSPW